MSRTALALDPPTGAASRELGHAEPSVRTLARVYEAEHPFVWRSLLRLGVSETQMDDAVHDVFMVVANRLHEFEGRASIRTWLFAIAMRVARAARRDAAREHVRHERLRQHGPQLDAPHESADASRMLYRLLDRLDDDKRAVFIMAELEGMTAPEIAAVVGAKVATVYSRLRLAREELERHAARARAADRRGER